MSAKVSFKAMNLGELIEALRVCKPEANISFDFGGFIIDGIGSYRGYYKDLALSYSRLHEPGNRYPIVAEVLILLQEANGSTFMGYKGGQYTMNLHTPVWVDRDGDCNGVGIVDVEQQLKGDWVLLRTWQIE